MHLVDILFILFDLLTFRLPGRLNFFQACQGKNDCLVFVKTQEPIEAFCGLCENTSGFV
jgi:hypothetical protein